MDPRSEDPDRLREEGLVTALQRASVKARLFASEPTSFVGRYVVVRHLGRGGMGDVFAAYDPQLDRKVALKLLRSDVESGEGPARLLREAQAMARLSHPNVITVHDVGVDQGQVFIAMELVEGVTLRQWLERSPRWKEGLRVMIAVGRGLAAAHAVGLVHRDLKPDNIMVSDDVPGEHARRVRVMDFGLARALEAPTTVPDTAVDDDGDGFAPEVPALAMSLTRAGTVAGTVPYMSPEQLAGDPTDERSDQFSYCIVLWEALYGQRPFQGDSVPAITTAIRQGRRKVPTDDPGIPGWLHGVLDRGLAIEPAQRFASMDELLRALESGQARARRRWGAVAMVGLVAFGGASFGVEEMKRRRAAQRCAEEGAAIAQTWNDDVSASLRDGLVATGLAHAADVHARAVPWIDRWVADWQAQRTEACNSARLDPTWTTELYARAGECFDERRDDLHALLDVFSQSDADALTRLVPAVASFTGAEPCADPMALARRPPQTIAEHTELRREMGRAEGLGLAGRYADAARLAQRTAEAAATAGDEALAADAWVTAGRNAEKAGDLDGSEHALRRALEISGRLGLDAMAADAATAMVYTVGMGRGKHDAGLAWGSAASVFVAKLGEDEQMRGATLWGQMGTMSWQSGSWDEAARLHERALAIKERILGTDHPGVAVTLLNLANVEDDRGDKKRSEELYRRALAIFETQLGPRHPGVASCANNLGSVASAKGEYREAIAFYERALAIRTELFGAGHISTASTINNVANAYFLLEELDEAERQHERALAIRREHLAPDHPDIASSLTNLAKVQRAMGRLERARALHEEALALREKALGREHPDVLDTLLALGRVQHNLKEYAHAEATYERARALAEKVHGAEHAHVASALVGLGDAASMQGRGADAIPLLERALRIREQIEIGPQWRAAARFALAQALWTAQRDRDRALELARAAREELRTAAPRDADRLPEIEAWLAEHDARAR